MKIKRSNAIVIAGIIIIVILLIIVFKVRNTNKVDYSKLTDQEIAVITQEKIENIKKKDLSGLGERDRMEYYVASFITAVENEKYEQAYEMLYEDFRKNFFPTVESFQEYVKNNFPKFISLNHTNFERFGDTYIMWTEMADTLGSKDSAVEMNFVVKENDLNDFVMSFEVFLEEDAEANTETTTENITEDLEEGNE